MSMTGGYTIADLGGASFTENTKKTIPGIYAAISNSDKPCLLTGIKVGSTKIKDMWLNLQKSGTTYLTQIPGYYIAFTNDDGVTFGAALPALTADDPTANGTYTLKGTKNSSGFEYDWVKDT